VKYDYFCLDDACYAHNSINSYTIHRRFSNLNDHRELTKILCHELKGFRNECLVFVCENAETVKNAIRLISCSTNDALYCDQKKTPKFSICAEKIQVKKFDLFIVHPL